MNIRFPYLDTGISEIDNAFRIAIGDLVGNIVPWKDGLLQQKEPVMMAGLDYNTPWTRDAAINTWNGGGLLFPEIAYNTLVSVLENKEGKTMIAGQYWDAVIWVWGAWEFYLFTGDKDFLKLALDATRNSLEYFEATEFDSSLHLFRGAACYGDGVAAYPEIYARTGGSSAVYDWPEANPELAAKSGYGLPMHALSTNCLYYNAYLLLGRFENELGLQIDEKQAKKAERLKSSINQHFWNESKGSYLYIVDEFGNCDYQEGLGLSFALLFGVADEKKARKILRNTHITPFGIPCVWPNFPRYESGDGMAFGRHSGTVWPHVQSFWAIAAAQFRVADVYSFELKKMAELANRYSHFAEVYHPLTGEIYEGVQEYPPDGAIRKGWKSCVRQTWSATGYIAIILKCVVGMVFKPSGIEFKPLITKDFGKIRLTNIHYRNMILDIYIKGSGTEIMDFAINGEQAEYPFLPAGGQGKKQIFIKMGN